MIEGRPKGEIHAIRWAKLPIMIKDGRRGMKKTSGMLAIIRSIMKPRSAGVRTTDRGLARPDPPIYSQVP
jgi:hypothetical protein